MSYPRTLDEYGSDELENELARRRLLSSRGVCPYCSRSFGSSPCRFPEQHGPLRLHTFLHLAMEAETERARAIKLFPGNRHNLLAFAEKTGELVKACRDSGLGAEKYPCGDAYKKAVRAAAMLARLWYEGDTAIGLPPLTDESEQLSTK